jgi:pimeloyl-ACP methyl ester carboxylesterase
METVTSADGTTIAYDRLGRGDRVILVGGALCDRHALRPLADVLARDFDVITYDRRGRGASGDSTPYSVEREVEDIEALLNGRSAAIYGHSSGAGLAAIAASSGLPFTKVALHEPPYGPDGADSSEDGNRVLELIREGQGREAVGLFLTMTGMPQPEALAVAGAPGMAEIAPTLAYDFAVMDYGQSGGGIPVELLRKITQDTLVVAGTASAPFMVEAAHRIVGILPSARSVELAGQQHAVPAELLAPVLADFLSRR